MMMKILTQNMWINHVTFKTSTEDKTQRIHDFATHLSQWDIVALQEVFAHKLFASLDYKQLMIDEAKKHGLIHVTQCRGPPSFVSQDAGLMILSRYPIVDSEFVSFETYSWYDMIVDKGFLYAKIQCGSSEDKVVHLITTHLDAHRSDVKLSQVKQLSNYVKSKLGSRVKSEPIVITGDWNIDAIRHEHDQYQEFLDQFPDMKNIYTAAPYPVTHRDHGGCLDHVLVNQFEKLVPQSDDGKVYRVEAFKGTGDRSNERVSDHYGISVELTL